MAKNTGKVGEFCQSRKVGTLDNDNNNRQFMNTFAHFGISCQVSQKVKAISCIGFQGRVLGFVNLVTSQ